ncbi:hypothetical protein BH09SUM1_BH09SUM1_03270 [soil metagenome]
MKKRTLANPRGGVFRGVLLAACCAAPLLIIAETVYVKVGSAPLKSGPGFSDPVVTQLKQGDALTVLERAATKVKVKTSGGQTGYVSSLNIATSKPSTAGSKPVILADGTATSERSNTSSIRGLEPISKEYAIQKQLPEKAVQDVEAMENLSLSITDADIEAFAQQGGVVQQ